MAEIAFNETSAARELDVTSGELRALRRARHGLIVEELSADPAHGGRVRVGPRTGYVGTVNLPGGRRVVVAPKARIANIPELLALAYRTLAPPPRSGIAAVETSTPTDWLIVQLVGEVHELLARGLRRGYVEKRERLPFVRGRTRPVLNPAQLPFLDCEYTDFVADTPVNRLLRGVLELLAPAARNRAVRRQLDEALSYFGEVAPTHPSLREFDRVRVTRLNEHYGPSLALARLALEGAGVTDAAGSATAPAYFVLMWKVWENSVASALRDAGVRRLLEKPTYTTAFRQVTGVPQLSVGIEPDLVIGRRLAPKLIVDLKWAPALVTDRFGRKRLRNEHLYQVGTYCAALHSDGMLIYPLMGEPVESTYDFEGWKIHIRTVDLDQPDLSGLRSAAADIAGLVNGS